MRRFLAAVRILWLMRLEAPGPGGLTPQIGTDLSTYDFAAQRLFVDAPLNEGARVAPAPTAQNYLLNVLRLRDGDPILLFNGRDGEWLARIEMVSRRAAALIVEKLLRGKRSRATRIRLRAAQAGPSRLYVQKAAEMGAARLTPVLTRRTQVRRVNIERLRANVIEAAEQCGLLNAPEIGAAQELEDWLAALPLIVCLSSATRTPPSRTRWPRSAAPRPRRRSNRRSRDQSVDRPEGGSNLRAGLIYKKAMSCGCLSAHAFCGPIRRPWRLWLWFRRFSGTGAEDRICRHDAATMFALFAINSSNMVEARGPNV